MRLNLPFLSFPRKRESIQSAMGAVYFLMDPRVKPEDDKETESPPKAQFDSGKPISYTLAPMNLAAQVATQTRLLNLGAIAGAAPKRDPYPHLLASGVLADA